MQIEATYEDGKLVLHRPVQFLHRRFTVRVEVPDQEVKFSTSPEAAPPEREHLLPQASGQQSPPPAWESLSAEASRWLARLDAMRAEAIAEAKFKPGALDGEQSERAAAFAMREES